MDTALKHAPDRPPGQHRTPLSPYRLLTHPQDLLGRGDAAGGGQDALAELAVDAVA
jgi:hypothetical protein